MGMTKRSRRIKRRSKKTRRYRYGGSTPTKTKTKTKTKKTKSLKVLGLRESLSERDKEMYDKSESDAVKQFLIMAQPRYAKHREETRKKKQY